MKSGFTIIEIVLVMLISSMLLVGLNQTFMQISKSVKSIARVIIADTPLVPFYNQMERDITGAFAPKESLVAFAKKQDKKPEDDQKTSAQDKSQERQEYKSVKPIENVFFVKSEEGEITWSFITTGGLDRLEKDGSLTTQPYVRRVYYKLEKDPQNTDLYRLIYRTESNDLALGAIEKKDFSPSYVIMQNIKNMSYEFTAFEVSEDNQKSKDSKKPEKKTLKEWKEEEAFEKYKTLIPAYVNVSGAYTDTSGQKSYAFSFDFKVQAYAPYDPEAEKEDFPRDQLQESADKSKAIFGKISKFADEKLGNLKPKQLG